VTKANSIRVFWQILRVHPKNYTHLKQYGLISFGHWINLFLVHASRRNLSPLRMKKWENGGAALRSRACRWIKIMEIIHSSGPVSIPRVVFSDNNVTFRKQRGGGDGEGGWSRRHKSAEEMTNKSSLVYNHILCKKNTSPLHLPTTPPPTIRSDPCCATFNGRPSIFYADIWSISGAPLTVSMILFVHRFDSHFIL